MKFLFDSENIIALVVIVVCAAGMGFALRGKGISPSVDGSSFIRSHRPAYQTIPVEEAPVLLRAFNTSNDEHYRGLRCYLPEARGDSEVEIHRL